MRAALVNLNADLVQQYPDYVCRLPPPVEDDTEGPDGGATSTSGMIYCHNCRRRVLTRPNWRNCWNNRTPTRLTCCVR